MDALVVRPVIHSDETWDSYARWFKRINGIDHSRRFELPRNCGVAMKPPSTLLVEILAAAADLTRNDL